MAKMIVKHDPTLTPDRAMGIFSAHFSQKYELYMTKLIGADFVLKKSGWSGVSFKILQRPGQTIIRFGTFSPSAFVRILQLGLIPVLILYFVSWKKLEKEVKDFILNAPEFKIGA
jgi:hypothetical protein